MVKCVIEENSILRDDPNTLANSLLRVMTNVVITNFDFSVERIIETEEQTRDSSFPTATVTNDGYQAKKIRKERDRGKPVVVPGGTKKEMPLSPEDGG